MRAVLCILVPLMAFSWNALADATGEADAPVQSEPATGPEEEVMLPPFNPGELLAEVEQALASEAEAVKAIREIHKAQIPLYEAERAAIAVLLEQDKADEAQDVAQRARSRIELLRSLYEQGLDRYPKSAELHNYHGEILYDFFGEQAGALKAWNMAISLDKKLSAPYNNLGLHQMHYGEYREGLRNLDTALELDPKNPDYLFNLAQHYMLYRPQVEELRGWSAEKIYREAMKLSKEAIKQAPEDYEIRWNHAANYFKADDYGVQADWTEAAEAWREARNVAPAQPQVINALMYEARAWLRAGKNDKAIEVLEQALELHPESSVARNLLERARAEQ